MGLSIIRTARWFSGQIVVLETLERSTQPTCTHRLAQVLARWLALLFEELPPSSWMPFAFFLNVTFPLMSTGEKNLSLSLGWVPKRTNNPVTYPCKLLPSWSDVDHILSSLGSLFLAAGQKYQKCWSVFCFLVSFLLLQLQSNSNEKSYPRAMLQQRVPEVPQTRMHLWERHIHTSWVGKQDCPAHYSPSNSSTQ